MNWETILSQVAFPIIVALFFMFRIEKVLGKLVVVMTEVRTFMSVVAKKNGLSTDTTIIGKDE